MTDLEAWALIALVIVAPGAICWLLRDVLTRWLPEDNEQ